MALSYAHTLANIFKIINISTGSLWRDIITPLCVYSGLYLTCIFVCYISITIHYNMCSMICVLCIV